MNKNVEEDREIEDHFNRDLIWYYERRQILVASETARDALNNLIKAHKEKSKIFSLGLISKKTGVSKGYLSDILNGRRNLNKRYWEVFCELFGLEGNAKLYFILLLERDLEEDADTLRRLNKELDAFRKDMNASFHTMPKVQGLFFAFEVACTFALFGNKPTKMDLRDYYGTSRAIELEYALHHLTKLKIIEKRDDHFGLLKDYVWFFDDLDGISIQEYLKQSINLGFEMVEKWSPRKDLAVMESAILSVKKSDLSERLPAIRDVIHKIQADLETSDGDTLIHFNVQIFPNR